MRTQHRRNQSGQGMTEYGLIIGLIATVVLAGFLGLSPSIKNIYYDALHPEPMGQGQASLSAAIY